jgi:arylmalonate decarboxylase
MIGLIVPPAEGLVPPEAPLLYPHLSFEALGLALPEISAQGFDAVRGAIVDKATQLAARGAEAISVMGTSLTFYRGAAANRALQAAIHDATGLPATTMSSAVVNALRALGAARVGVATAYIDDLNQRLQSFLVEEGFEIAALQGLAMKDVRSVRHVAPQTLIELVERVFEADRSAEAILLSCGGLLTLDILAGLEARLGVPVVASSPAGFWDVVRLAGHDAAAPGFGRLCDGTVTA